MSVTTERIGELLREAEALKAEGQWSLEHQSILFAFLNDIERRDLQGKKDGK